MKQDATMPSIQDIVRDPAVVAGASGALLAAWKRTEYSRWQKVTAFLTGFLAAIWIAPIVVEYFAIQDHKRYGVVFLIGYLADVIMSPLLFWIEKEVPLLAEAFVGKYLPKGKRKK